MRIQSQNHAMGSSLGIGFRTRHRLLIIEEFMPEPGIQQVQCGMLHTAVVPVYRHPVIQCLFAGQCLFIIRICIAQEIPGRPCPLGHGIGLPLCRPAAAGTGCIDPISHQRQRRLSGICGHITLHFRQFQRQFTLIKRHIAALLTVYDRDWLAPVTLSGEYPVTQFKVCLGTAHTLFFQNGNHLLFGIRHAESV